MQPSMAATGATQPGAPSSTGATGSTTSQDLSGTDTFLKLLVAQLRNQDPTSPMDSQSFITELAQFNTVEQMINLKQSVNAQASAQQAGEGMALLGKTITYTIQSLGGGNTTTSQGVVTGVMLQGGQVQLQVGTQNVPLNQVTAVAGS
jgi:flagellar hook assembly protein FlgD